MTLAYITAVIAGAIGAYLMTRIPGFLYSERARATTAALSVHNFFDRAEKLVKDARTPPEVVEFIEDTSLMLDRPKLARRVLYWTLRGKLRRDTSMPSERIRNFHKIIAEMPQELSDAFVEAVVFAVASSAMHAGALGDLLLNIMLFDARNPRANKAAGATVAAEVADSCYRCAAA